VFYRRLPHQTSAEQNQVPSNEKKDIWTSRMDMVYQEDWPIVQKGCDVLELEDGEEGFVGKDADGIWADGFTADPPGPTQRGLTKEKVDAQRRAKMWPFYKDPVGSYPMFRNRF